MHKIYFIKFSWDGGRSFRVIRRWFFQNILIDINRELENFETKGMKNPFVESVEVIR